MSYAAYKMMHWPTGIENCASGFITHSGEDLAPQITPILTDDLESEWPLRKGIGPIPDLVVTAGNILEIYVVRVQEEEGSRGFKHPPEAKIGSSMAGILGAWLELVCHYKYFLKQLLNA